MIDSEKLPNSRIVLALDKVERMHQLLMMAHDIGSQVHAVKINSRFESVFGLARGVAKLHEQGVVRYFYDESLNDQVPEKIEDLAKVHIHYVSIDARIGVRAMRKAVETRNAVDRTRTMRLIATTVLPQHPSEDIERTYRQSVPSLIENLSTQAAEAGMDGVYCSASGMRFVPTSGLMRVATGVRLRTIPNDDKIKTVSPQFVAQLDPRADLIVVGSAITEHTAYDEYTQAFDTIRHGLQIDNPPSFS